MFFKLCIKLCNIIVKSQFFKAICSNCDMTSQTEQIVMDEYKPSGESDLISEDVHASLGHYIKF